MNKDLDDKISATANYPGMIFAEPRRGAVQRLRTWLREVKTKPSALSVDPKLRFVSGADKPLRQPEIAVVVVVRNERKYLPSFLSHYRLLGATRFIVVDDLSSDGTAKYLRLQQDVDLWVSDLRFKEAAGGLLWREVLMSRYGLDRWYLNVDIDEFLVYDRAGPKTLTDLTNVLHLHGYTRLPAPMIDFYSRFGHNEALTDDVMPWHIANEFDGSGYFAEQSSRGWSVKGGPRARKLGLANELIKYPLIYWDSACSLSRCSIHMPQPFARNFTPIGGVLLHFKFFSDIGEKVASAISDGQHFNNAAEYRVLEEALRKQDGLDFHDDAVSLGYLGPDQLVEFGFMPRLWD